jgi:hypothetical protein
MQGTRNKRNNKPKTEQNAAVRRGAPCELIVALDVQPLIDGRPLCSAVGPITDGFLEQNVPTDLRLGGQQVSRFANVWIGTSRSRSDLLAQAHVTSVKWLLLGSASRTDQASGRYVDPQNIAL